MLLPCTTPFHTSHIAKLILNANKKAFLPCSPFWACRNPPPYNGPKKQTSCLLILEKKRLLTSLENGAQNAAKPNCFLVVLNHKP